MTPAAPTSPAAAFAQPSDERRRELAELLRTRRNQLDRAGLSLPPVTRGRTPGLRREEVAFLSGVSLTWYTWLEQGRDIHPSREVVDAIARTLRLSRAERAYALTLAGFTAPEAPGTTPMLELPAHVQRLLDAQGTSPAFALTPDWTIAGWNAAYAALFPGVESVDPAERNMLWLVFTDPWVRELLPAWEDDARRFLAEFRAEAGARLGAPELAGLVERLTAASPQFAAWWPEQDVEGFASRERLFRHPRVGELRLEHHRLAPSDHPDLHVVIYTPAPGSDAAERLAELVSAG